MLHQQIHNYKIVSLLGEGGMANVYLAIHQTLGNKVALKLLKEEFVQHPNIRKRFLAEARNLAQMSHPNVIKVTDLIDAGDIVAFVMEYIEGETLEHYIERKGKLSNEEIETLFNQMMEAIEYVHSQGLIHRDIKPSNFMLTKSGSIKLLDFGIAKNTNDSAVDYTKTGLMQQMGTPMYMSPEQVKNTSEVTRETDIYSLGVVLWQMVTGKKPYDSNTLSLPEIQVAILKEALPLTDSVWDQVIKNMTEKFVFNRNLLENKTTLSQIKFDKIQSISNEKIDNSIYPKIWLLILGITFILGVIILIFITFFSKDTIDFSEKERNEINQIQPKDSNEKQIKVIVKKQKSSSENQDTESKTVIEKKESETQKNLKIGQKYEGGIIFHLDNSGNHGKICATTDLGAFSWESALEICTNSKINGFNDWSLPSMEELRMIYKNRNEIGGFNNYWYWSKTENDSKNSFGINFRSLNEEFADKRLEFYVRPIRLF